MKKSYELDMCNGPILGKILVFAIPLMISAPARAAASAKEPAAARP